MSASKRFAQTISHMTGVARFVLVRNDGQVIIHNLADPDELATTITLAGTNVQEIQKASGFSPFKYLLFPHPLGEHLLVFALGKYFLGVRVQSDCDNNALIDEITAYLQTLINQGRPG
jgi:hypothetical protein